jgi:hypothetical protein
VVNDAFERYSLTPFWILLLLLLLHDLLLLLLLLYDNQVLLIIRSVSRSEDTVSSVRNTQRVRSPKGQG